MIELTNNDIEEKCFQLSEQIEKELGRNDQRIYGVPRGGISVGYLLSAYLTSSEMVDTPEEADIIVDDIIDSGETKKRYEKYGKPFYALYENSPEWLSFPWERSDNATPLKDNVERIRQYSNDSDTNKAEAMNLLHNLMEELREA